MPLLDFANRLLDITDINMHTCSQDCYLFGNIGHNNGQGIKINGVKVLCFNTYSPTGCICIRLKAGDTVQLTYYGATETCLGLYRERS